MPEFLTNIIHKATEFWKNLDKSQKVRIYVTSGILLVAVAASIFWLTRPNQVVLISNAEPKDIKEMQTILDDKGIWSEVKSNNLIVNMKDSDKAHFELGAAGYPKNGMTFADAYSYISFNTTESDKKQIWKQYQKASLESQLKMFENVEDAKVELITPEKSFFVSSDSEQSKPTAAVTIVPKGDSLTPSQVEGIIMVVARSVEGLDPKDITVVDNTGNILNAEAEDSDIEQTNNEFDMKLKVKNLLEKNVREMFNGQFDNFDTLRVVVNPVLDFNKQKTQTQDVTNGTGMTGGALISSKQTKEDLQNADASGVPGTDTNPGTTTSPSYQVGTNGNSTYKKQTTEQNFDYKRVKMEEEKALGAMDPEKSSMTVTLLYGMRVKNDKITTNFIDQFKSDVSKATGIPVASISINKYKLAEPEVTKTSVSDNLKKFIDDYGFFALMLLLILALVITAIPRRKKVVQPQPIPALAEAAAAASTPRFIVPETEDEEVPEIDTEERSEVKKQIEKFVKQKPEAVAQLLRNWLSDDWE